VAKYEANGLSHAEFCKRKDVPLKTLGRYLTRYRKQAAGGTEPYRFVAVEVAWHSCGGVSCGASVMHRLATDLKRAFPDMKGFSPRNRARRLFIPTGS
jgi:hypothetical protein